MTLSSAPIHDDNSVLMRLCTLQTASAGPEQTCRIHILVVFENNMILYIGSRSLYYYYYYIHSSAAAVRHGNSSTVFRPHTRPKWIFVVGSQSFFFLRILLYIHAHYTSRFFKHTHIYIYIYKGTLTKRVPRAYNNILYMIGTRTAHI